LNPHSHLTIGGCYSVGDSCGDGWYY
jgi:hypothetical protein